jgi:hypothetical protein
MESNGGDVSSTTLHDEGDPDHQGNRSMKCKITCSCDDVCPLILYFFLKRMKKTDGYEIKDLKGGEIEIPDKG